MSTARTWSRQLIETPLFDTCLFVIKTFVDSNYHGGSSYRPAAAGTAAGSAASFAVACLSADR